MAKQMSTYGQPDRKAFIITGPTSGIGRATALEVAKHSTVVLVARDAGRLSGVQKAIEQNGGRAVSVVCDFSHIASVKRAAAETVALGLPIAGLLNNAGIMPMKSARTAQGWDQAFASNHLGPFAFTGALIPHLPDGAHVVFICSGVEDPERKPAVAAGFRGARYISAEASARGEWLPGGSSNPGFDAYATSKQCNLATVLVFARETPRLRFNAVEPGFNPSTGLGRDANVVFRFLGKYVLGPLAPPHQIMEHPATCRSGDHRGLDRRVQRHRRVLRREGPAYAWLRTSARPCLRWSSRGRDAGPAFDLSSIVNSTFGSARCPLCGGRFVNRTPLQSRLHGSPRSIVRAREGE